MKLGKFSIKPPAKPILQSSIALVESTLN